jgi:hypothetical protein
MRGRNLKSSRKQKRPNPSEWTLNDWLEKAWKDGLRRPTEAYLAADCPFSFEYPPTPDPLRLSPDAFKAMIYLKGWLFKDLAVYWGMRPESLTRIIYSTNRSLIYDDALLGLPMRCHWGALLRNTRVREVVMGRVSYFQPIELRRIPPAEQG